MNDKEISEIRRRYRAEKSGISRIRGCYVNEKRTIISEFDQSLGLMSESEAEEVLTLLRKALSGKVGTNLMDIAFSTAQVQSGAEHGLLMTLRESALGDDAAVHAFYEKVIGSLALEGNYMILLCHDSYDVFSYHKDGGRSEDSGEIFRYILCAICPVSMAKPALSYFVRDNCFRNITADSVVAPPALGFLFPAFDNRSTNLYGALYYTRDTIDSHEEFTDAVFRAGKLPMPAAAQQETFRNVLAESVGEACSLPVVRAVRAQICQAVEDHKASKEPEPLKRDNTYRYQHDVLDLLRALDMIAERNARQLPPPTANFKGIVGKEPYPIGRKTGEVLRQLVLRGVERLKSLFRGNKSRSEIVATFLAILELCKTNSVVLEDDNSGENPNVRLIKTDAQEES